MKNPERIDYQLTIKYHSNGEIEFEGVDNIFVRVGLLGEAINKSIDGVMKFFGDLVSSGKAT